MTFVYYELQHYTPAYFSVWLNVYKKQTNKQTNKINVKQLLLHIWEISVSLTTFLLLKVYLFL